MPSFLTLDDFEVRGKRVLLRADLNVPVRNGVVTDIMRIERLAPTIRELADKGARVVVMSHFGRPEHGFDPALSLKPLVEPLGKAIERPVVFAPDCVGAEVRRIVDALRGLNPRSNRRFSDSSHRSRTVNPSGLRSVDRSVIAS